MFADPDWIHSSLVNDELKIEIELKNNNFKDEFIDIQKVGAGSINLTLSALPGYKESVDTTFRIKASDNGGEEITTDWISTAIRPKSEKTLIRRGVKNSLMPQLVDDISAAKNTSIRLFEVLDINQLIRNDKEGDEVIVNILVENESAILNINGIDLEKSNSSNNSSLFKINSEEIGKLTGAEPGDLNGIELKLPKNRVVELGDKTSKTRFGVPIKIWTETRVKGDVEAIYGIQASPIYDIQLELKQ